MFFFFNFDNSKQDTNNYESVTVAICNIVQSLMENVMDRVLVTAPFVAEDHHAKKPLYAALVPDEIFKGAHFERRFVTPFGTAWEKLAMDGTPVQHAYYALPYNPYIKRENYEWSFPGRWFNMKEDSCVLIGEELWDLIGGEGTYQLFISEINKLGAHYKERIYREFLCIEPPEGFDKATLR